MLSDGQADIGIATEALQDNPDLAAFPYYAWHHGVIVPQGHVLTGEKLLTLDKLAEWPIVTYQRGYTGRARIDAAFETAELIPNIVMSALDADVIKAYVELELGIGIIASMAFNPERDPHLALLDARHLFAGNTSRIAVRRGSYLRGYAYRFIELCSSKLDEPAIRAGSAATGDGRDK